MFQTILKFLKNSYLGTLLWLVPIFFIGINIIILFIFGFISIGLWEFDNLKDIFNEIIKTGFLRITILCSLIFHIVFYAFKKLYWWKS